MTVAYSNRDLDVLKKTIWLEARGEPHEGQVAVAHVIKNRARVNRRYFGGNTIAGVSLHPAQFSCWNNTKPENVNPRGEGWEGMDGWVRGVLDGAVSDPTNGALYYINPSLCNPSWTKNLRVGVKIANHQFYNENFYFLSSESLYRFDAAMDLPIKITDVLQLNKVGIDLSKISLSNVTMDSEKFIVCREKGLPGDLLIIDLADPDHSMRLSTKADSVIMHTRQRIIAMKSGKVIHIFYLWKNEYVKKHTHPVEIIYWKWLDEQTIGLVTKTSVFHWDWHGDSAPTKVFDIERHLASGRVVDHRVDEDRRFCHIIGSYTTVDSFTESAILDPKVNKSRFCSRLFDRLTGMQYFGSGYTASFACFVKFKRSGSAEPSNLLVSFIVSMDRDQGGLLCIKRTSPAHGERNYEQRKIRVNSISPLTNDALLSIQASETHGVIYLVTELGFVQIFDLETGNRLYGRRISEDPIFAVTEMSSGGITCINKLGQISVNETAMVDYITSSKRIGSKSANRSLAHALSQRWQLVPKETCSNSIRNVILAAGEDPDQVGADTIKYVKKVVKKYKKTQDDKESNGNELPRPNKRRSLPPPPSPPLTRPSNSTPSTPTETSPPRPLPSRPSAPQPKPRTSVNKSPSIDSVRADKAEKERDEIAARYAELKMTSLIMNQEMINANLRAEKERDEIAGRLTELEMKYRTILFGRSQEHRSMSSRHAQSLSNLARIE